VPIIVFANAGATKKCYKG